MMLLATFNLGRNITLFIFILLLTACDFKQEEKKSIVSHEESTYSSLTFPEDYLGHYKGTLNIHNKSGTQQTPMEFKLQATDTSGTYHYILIYGEGDTYHERKYTLIEKDKSKGTYVVDENNGIVMDDKLVGAKLYSLFEVKGNLLTTFMTFKEDHLIFEITFANKEAKNVSISENETPIEVISYPISTVQTAILTKQ